MPFIHLIKSESILSRAFERVFALLNCAKHIKTIFTRHVMHCLFIIVMFLLSNVVVNSEIKCEIKTHKKIEQPDCENNDVKMRKWLEKTKVVEWLKKNDFLKH